MHDNPSLFPFPELPDEAVLALNDFIEQLYNSFTNHYFVQLRQYYTEQADPSNYIPCRHNDQINLPLEDPPF